MFPVRRGPLARVLPPLALCMLATCQLETNRIDSEASIQLAAGATVYLEVEANAAAADHADRFHVALWTSSETELRVVFDDEALAPATIEGGPEQVELDLTQCTRGEPCAFGMTVENLSGLSDAFVLRPALERAADPSLCLPDDRSFPPAARIAIRIDPS